MIIAGIDYSLTSPSICVHEGTDWSIENCKLHYLVKKKDLVVKSSLLEGSMYPSEWKNDQDRYDKLSEWSMSIITSSDSVAIEGYAFGAVGRVFHIAENCGVLKQKLWSSSIKFDVPAPGEIKKFATGKGNANKEKMFDAFYSETKIDLFDKLSIKNRNNWNPVSDMIDAYYICKLHHSRVYKSV